MIKSFKKTSGKIKASGLVEYCLILALVSVTTIGALGALGSEIKKGISQVNNKVEEAVKEDNLCPPGSIYVPARTPGMAIACVMR